MTERQLVSRLFKQLRTEWPEYYWYKPGDTFGGHKKPADMMACIDGKFVVLEAKIETGKLNPNQEKAMNSIRRSKGIYLVLRFFDKHILVDGPIQDYTMIKWEKGRYTGLDKLINLILTYNK